VPLRVNRLAGGEIELTWGDSCGLGDTDYEVYSGALGSVFQPTPQACSTGGATSFVVSEDPGDRYYLIVPRTPLREGSYGLDGAGLERPPAAGSCLRQELAVCGPS
jgi:hypothetical protein